MTKFFKNLYRLLLVGTPIFIKVNLNSISKLIIWHHVIIQKI